jgi:two-component system, chemotaxis family, protein-glutamate methylesterase/glutaminase
MNPAKTVRVVVAEDSVTARELIVGLLRSDPEVVVVGEARNGAEAVELTKKLRPNVVTMDIRMPLMDGFEATKQIMTEAPTPIVIVSASLDGREVEAAMHALRAGALTLLPKPPGPGAPAFERSRRQFVATVKAMSEVSIVRRWPEHRLATYAPAEGRGRRVRGRLVALAASTGGPAALQCILSDLPGDFPVPIVAVQHIASGFVTGLAAWLNEACSLRVKVAGDGERLLPRTVYLAPDDSHLVVSADGTVSTSSDAAPREFRPSASVLFESVAKAFGPSGVAVVLTGMGHDGAQGLEAVHAAGGHVIAQDEDSSVVFGMPAAAIAAGVVDEVLAVRSIAARLMELV